MASEHAPVAGGIDGDGSVAGASVSVGVFADAEAPPAAATRTEAPATAARAAAGRATLPQRNDDAGAATAVTVASPAAAVLLDGAADETKAESKSDGGNVAPDSAGDAEASSIATGQSGVSVRSTLTDAERAAEFAAYNPFDEQFPWSCWDILRTIVCSVTLFPVRLLVFVVLMLLVYLVCLAVTSCRGRYDNLRGCYEKRPISSCTRSALTSTVRVLVRVLLFVWGFYWISIDNQRPNKGTKARKVVPHTPAPDGGPATPGSGAGDPSPKLAFTGVPKVVVSNHPGSVDVLAMFLISPARFVGKKFFAKVPFIGTVGKAIGTIYVDRKSPDSRAAARQALVDISQATDDPTVLPINVFPEGTTENGKCIIKFQAGSFRGAAPVQPLVITFKYKRFNPAWAAIGFAEHVWRLGTQVYNRMHITVLPPYVPNAEEQADTIAFSKAVRNAMAEAASLRTSELDYRDGLQWWDEHCEELKQRKGKGKGKVKGSDTTEAPKQGSATVAPEP